MAATQINVHKKKISGRNAWYQKMVQHLNIDPLDAAIYIRRGIQHINELRYFVLDHLYLTHNPTLMPDITKAALRILEAARHNQKVFIFGDRDVDGMTSVALLVHLCTHIGIKPEWRVPTGNETYGITTDIVQQCIDANTQLIITIDCGIHNITEIELANSHNIDTLVIDHHNITDQLPNAYAVVNPKRNDTYPMQDICACTLAYKVALVTYLLRSPDPTPQVLAVARRSVNTYYFDLYKVENARLLSHHQEVVADPTSRHSYAALVNYIDTSPCWVYNSAQFTTAFQEAYQHDPPTLHQLQPLLKKIDPTLGAQSLYDLNQQRLIEDTIHAGAQAIETLYALHTHIRLNNAIPAQIHSYYLQMVAIATIADAMPMQNENRLLVKEGMRLLTTSPAPCFRLLLQEHRSRNTPVTSMLLAFHLIPQLNAAGRQGVPETAIKLLLSGDSAEIKRHSNTLNALNQERKDHLSAAASLAMPIAKKQRSTNAAGTIVAHPSIPRGVTGLVANRIVDTLHCSAVVISLGDHQATGSMRTIPAHQATHILQHCSHHLIEWGGHDRAAGFQIAPQSVDSFSKEFLSHIQSLPTPTNPPLEIDAEIPLNHFSTHLFDISARFEPYGGGNPPLLFLTRGLIIKDRKLFGKDYTHVRLLLQCGKYKVAAIMWSGVELYNTLFKIDTTIDALYNVEMDYYTQPPQPRLVLVTCSRCISNSDCAVK